MPTSTWSTVQEYLLLVAPLLVPSTAAVLGFRLRNVAPAYRYVLGVVGLFLHLRILLPLSNECWKQLFPSSITNSRETHLWTSWTGTVWFIAANGFLPLVGGNKYLIKHGINSYSKAVASGISNGGIYFRKNPGAQYKALKRLMKSIVCCAALAVVARMFRLHPDVKATIESHSALHLAVLAFCFAMLIEGGNIMPNVVTAVFCWNDDFEIKEPSVFCYFEPNIRAFWKRWSRPIGEFLRYAAYEPLGGRSRYWLSVPAVFAMNCVFHYEFSNLVYGYSAVVEWSKAFAVMGASMALFMFTEDVFLAGVKGEKACRSRVEDSVYWKVWAFGLFHVSMMAAIDLTRDKAMLNTIDQLINTFKAVL